MTVALDGMTVARARGGMWERLRPFTDTIEHDDQVLLVAATGGSKSTLVASLTLGVPHLIALDGKAALVLPSARRVELPEYDPKKADGYLAACRKAVALRDDGINRVVLRPHALDIDGFEAHNLIFRAVYERRGAILWVDEITATGATANRVQPWLRAISARGRTRAIGLWTCTQAPFGLTPGILRRNAKYIIVGPIDSEDVGDIRREGIEIVETIPRKSGRFIVYTAGQREPRRLYVPIPSRLRGWRAP
jgi:hypothetical protein